MFGNARVIGQHFIVALAEIFLRFFADGDNRRVLSFHLGCRQFEHAGVVAACQTAVARDDKEQTFFDCTAVGVHT